MTTARFVGGTAAGQEIDVQGPTHRIQKLRPMPSFEEMMIEALSEECQPIVAEYEEYELHPVKFGTGHRHTYAAPRGWPLVSVLNDLWHSYQVTQQLSDEVTELQSQNERLKHELWREKYHNQFGKYPSNGGNLT